MLWIREEKVFSGFDYGAIARGAEASISMAFVVMCAEKIRRLLRLFFVTIFAWLFAWERAGCLWAGLRQFWQLETTELLVVG